MYQQYFIALFISSLQPPDVAPPCPVSVLAGLAVDKHVLVARLRRDGGTSLVRPLHSDEWALPFTDLKPPPSSGQSLSVAA